MAKIDANIGGSTSRCYVAIERPPLATALDRAVAAVSHSGAGGVVTFIGVVREQNDGRAVTLLEYEAYESMALLQMQRIGEQLVEEISGLRIAAIHRVGALTVGEWAVVCAASAPHRGEAFEGCRLLIDRIKKDVPIWKREHGPDGPDGPDGPYWVGWEDARCDGLHGGDAHGSDARSPAHYSVEMPDRKR